MADNFNYPYSLLLNKSGAIYLSAIVNTNRNYIIDDRLNDDTSSDERQLEFKTITFGGNARFATYEVNKTTSSTYTKTITIENGVTNKSWIYVANAIKTTDDLTLPLRYHPHTYLSKSNTHGKLVYSLHIAIPTIRHRAFKRVNLILNSTERIYQFQEFEDSTFEGEYFPIFETFQSELKTRDTIVIQVYELNAALPALLLPKVTGTIRHSTADNKPFDLLGCE